MQGAFRDLKAAQLLEPYLEYGTARAEDILKAAVNAQDEPPAGGIHDARLLLLGKGDENALSLSKFVELLRLGDKKPAAGDYLSDSALRHAGHGRAELRGAQTLIAVDESAENAAAGREDAFCVLRHGDDAAAAEPVAAFYRKARVLTGADDALVAPDKATGGDG